MPWSVYILKCSDNSYDTGHTENIEARLKLHNNDKGATHTATRRPVRLLYQENAGSKNAAMKR